jgi:hypothetical protein
MNETNGTGGARRLAVFAMHEYPDKEDDSRRHTRWMRIGVGFPNRDGSINLFLDAFPIGTNRLQIREDERVAAGAPRKNGFETVEVRP